jgi:hypothetical protein
VALLHKAQETQAATHQEGTDLQARRIQADMRLNPVSPVSQERPNMQQRRASQATELLRHTGSSPTVHQAELLQEHQVRRLDIRRNRADIRPREVIHRPAATVRLGVTVHPDLVLRRGIRRWCPVAPRTLPMASIQ